MKRRNRTSDYNNKYNNDHIVAKDIWWTNHPDNIQRILITYHRAKHTVFKTKSTVDKLLHILEEDLPALQWDFVRDVKHILEIHRWYEYHDHVIKKPYKR